jgi:tetratricopeptide (TPR) repeat protein
MGIWSGDDATDIERVERAVAATRFEQMPVENRPYLALAAAYAQAHRSNPAKAFLARYDAEVRDSLQRRREANARRDAIAWIALADNRPLDAVREFTRESDELNVCYACTQASIGIAYDKAGMADSSIAYFERFFVAGDRGGPDGSYRADLWFRALAFRRLGELYEKTGNIGKAVTNYAAFVDLWKDADPDLQRHVQAARRKLKKLSDMERSVQRP